MKKIKFLAMLLLAVSMSFAFVSCGDDDDDNKIVNPNGGGNVQIGVGEWTDDGSMISFTITESYAGGPFKTHSTMVIAATKSLLTKW